MGWPWCDGSAFDKSKRQLTLICRLCNSITETEEEVDGISPVESTCRMVDTCDACTGLRTIASGLGLTGDFDARR